MIEQQTIAGVLQSYKLASSIWQSIVELNDRVTVLLLIEAS